MTEQDIVTMSGNALDMGMGLRKKSASIFLMSMYGGLGMRKSL